MNDGGSVSTGCGPVDDLLGGGLERGTVTQVYGPPASGKTNLALSTAVATAAAGGMAAVVDTEGISLDRFEQLVEPHATGEETVETLTERIVVTSAHDFDEQEDAIRDLADLASQLELVVVDSLTGFYRLARTGDAEAGDALRQVASQVTHLLSLARKHDLAVLVTNQVFSDPESDAVRALGGNTLEHWTGTVLRIDRFRGGNRRVTLEKHRSRAEGETARFRITDAGLEGVDEAGAF